MYREKYDSRVTAKSVTRRGNLHLNVSTESDHRIAKAAGGQGVLENGLLVHLLCNRRKSDISLEETRADLFDELLYSSISKIWLWSG